MVGAGAGEEKMGTEPEVERDERGSLKHLSFSQSLPLVSWLVSFIKARLCQELMPQQLLLKSSSI